MNLSRHAIALLGSVAMLGGTALAAPPLLGGTVNAGAAGNVGVGAPPVGVPPVNVPHPLNAPPVNVPKPNPPQPNANVRVNANANAGAQVTTGTLTAINGNTVTVRLRNGSTQSYNVSAQTAADLRAMLNKPIAYRIENGLLTTADEGNGPLHGTIQAVNGGTAVLRLANGTTQSYAVTAQQAAWLKAHTGKAVVFWAGANGTLELNQRSNNTKPHGKKSR